MSLPGFVLASFLELMTARTQRLEAPLVFGSPTRELENI